PAETLWQLKVQAAFASGAEATAVQMLCECQTVEINAKRLDCGAFTAAFGGMPSNEMEGKLVHG
ncbi:MAG: hypothetical protein AAB370_10605, partial [Verrucomicrobiota bacterium]